MTSLPEKIGIGSVTTQLLPFYSGNVTYSFQADQPKDGAMQLEASYDRGALIGVEADGKKRGDIIFPPYRLLIPDLKKGVHEVKLTLFGHRNNSFGPLHMVNRKERWIGPAAWRTRDQDWCYEYQLSPLGILKSPEMTFLEERDKKSDLKSRFFA